MLETRKSSHINTSPVPLRQVQKVGTTALNLSGTAIELHFFDGRLDHALAALGHGVFELVMTRLSASMASRWAWPMAPR
jgi:hypothetical protein